MEKNVFRASDSSQLPHQLTLSRLICIFTKSNLHFLFIFLFLLAKGAYHDANILAPEQAGKHV
jgi:hypothetical protein